MRKYLTYPVLFHILKIKRIFFWHKPEYHAPTWRKPEEATMAKIHTTPYRAYEDLGAQVDRFETAINKGGLIDNAREAVKLLVVLSKSDDGDLRHIRTAIEYGITNRLQESMNIAPAVDPNAKTED
jgi:hypothetical protein